MITGTYTDMSCQALHPGGHVRLAETGNIGGCLKKNEISISLFQPVLSSVST